MMAKKLRRLAAILGTAAVIAGFGAGAVNAQSDELPDGPGKDDLTQVCTQCHAAGLITQRRRTADEWAEIMTRMKGMGAMMDDETQASILAYLDKNLGKPAAPTAGATAAAIAAPSSQH